MSVRASDLVIILVTLVFPPAGAYFVAGCGRDLVINILLTILGYFPAYLHAFWLIYQLKAEERVGAGRAGRYRYERSEVAPPSAPINNHPPQDGRFKYEQPQSSPGPFGPPQTKIYSSNEKGRGQYRGTPEI